MGFEEYLKPEYFKIETGTLTNNQILRKIIKIAKKAPELKHIQEERIFTAFKEREKKGSMALSNGIAIIHCSFEDLNNFVVGLLKTPEGIDYNSLDGEKTQFFFFIICPKEKREIYLEILSSLTKVIKEPEVLDELQKSPTEIDMINCLLRNAPLFNTKSKTISLLSLSKMKDIMTNQTNSSMVLMRY